MSGFPQALGLPILGQTILAANAAQISFANIPQTAGGLLLVAAVRSTAAATSDQLNITFNGDTGNNYDTIGFNDYSGAFAQVNDAAQTSLIGLSVAAANATAGVPGRVRLEIPGYAQTTFWKIGQLELGFNYPLTAGGGFRAEAQWRSTAAITSMLLTLAAGNFLAGSFATLYGLA